ncbi:MAG: ABC transporter substrate-binding protein [Acidimicrobiales bacterium]
MSTGGTAPEVGMYIALERGYFRAEGLDVQLVSMPGGASDTFPALAAGQLDFAVNPMGAALLNAIQRDVNLRVVAPAIHPGPDAKTNSIVVRQDLIDSGRYKTAADLKGMTIGVGPGIVDVGELVVRKTLANVGLQPSDVSERALGFPEEVTALSTKQLDAAEVVEPFGLQTENQGLAKAVLFAGAVLADCDCVVLIVSPTFAERSPEAVRRLVTGQLRGQRDYYNAFQGSSPNRADRPAIYDILAKYTTIKNPQLYAALDQADRLPAVDPNDTFHSSGFDTVQQYFVDNGVVPSKLPLDRIVDDSYIQYALQRLGRIPQ